MHVYHILLKASIENKSLNNLQSNSEPSKEHEEMYDELKETDFSAGHFIML